MAGPRPAAASHQPPQPRLVRSLAAARVSPALRAGTSRLQPGGSRLLEKEAPWHPGATAVMPRTLCPPPLADRQEM
eukprot:2210932-Alexandrium_andersonii.AAC.1